MEPESKKADVESRLNQTAEAMSDRLASIQDEVTSTGGAVREWIVENPVKSVGGMLATGLAVGLLFGGSRSRLRKEHSELVDTYLDALREEAEAAVEEGDEPGPALEKALSDRVPLVVYSQEEGPTTGGSGEDSSFLRQGAEIIFSTGLSLLARQVIDSVLANVNVEEIVEEAILE